MLVPEHISPILVTAKLGTAGVDLFAHRMPAGITSGIVIVGDLAGAQIDHDLPGWRIGRIQVIVRNASHIAGTALAHKIIQALTLGEHSLPAAGGASALRLRRLRPLHDPIAYPRSDGDLIEFSINFEGAWTVAG